jgi:hypothetical protein
VLDFLYATNKAPYVLQQEGQEQEKEINTSGVIKSGCAA